MSNPNGAPPINEELVKQAQSFLQKIDVKSTSLGSRISFLEQRGLNRHEIAVALSRINQHEDAQKVLHGHFNHPHHGQHPPPPHGHQMQPHHYPQPHPHPPQPRSTQWYMGVAALTVGVGSLVKFLVNKWTQRKLDNEKSIVEKHYEQRIQQLEEEHAERVKQMRETHRVEIRKLEERQHKDLMTIVELIKNQTGNLNVALTVLRKAVILLNTLQAIGKISNDKTKTVTEDDAKIDDEMKVSSGSRQNAPVTPTKRGLDVLEERKAEPTSRSPTKSQDNTKIAENIKNLNFDGLRGFAERSTSWGKPGIGDSSHKTRSPRDKGSPIVTLPEDEDDGQEEEDDDDTISVITPAAAKTSSISDSSNSGSSNSGSSEIPDALEEPEVRTEKQPTGKMT